MSLRIYQYENSSISFEVGDDTLINVTEMCKAVNKSNAEKNEYNRANNINAPVLPTNKMAKDYLRMASTQEFIAEYITENSVRANPLTVIQGGQMQGTWMNADLALDFAQWLSPKFRVWMNARIKELMQHGVTAINPEDLLNPDMMIKAMEALKTERARNERLSFEKEQLQIENSALAPKAKVFDEVMDSSSLLNTTEVALNLGMSAVALNKKLAEKKIQRKMSDGTWVLSADYLNKGYAKLIPFVYSVKDGQPKTKQNLMWTEKGRHFISQILQKSA